ncbi:MAG: AAA family ATPase [Acidobacteriia bacterium]|nr:AAA family ATPase [Terriglobia bacterium]
MRIGRVEQVSAGGKIEVLYDSDPNNAKPEAEAQPDSKIKGVTRCFADIAPEPVRWLWPARIPLGKFTLLIGDPGLGKSMVTIDMSSRVSTGMKFPDGGACERGGVLLLSAEDDAADTIRPRLDAAGADVSLVHTLEAVRVYLADGAVSERGFNLEADIGALEDALTRIPGIRLIVIDPISAYLGNTDSHVNSEVRGLLTPLVAIASRYGVAVVGVAHLRKSAGAAVHRAIGSIAFAAAARSVWAVGTDPSDPERRLMLPVKQNLTANIGGLAFRIEGPEGVPRLDWDPEAVNLDATEILMGAFDGGEGQGALQEAEAWLADLLAEGPVPARKIQSEAKAAGLAWHTVRRAKDALGVEPSKGAFHSGWSWSLPNSQDAQEAPKMPKFESRASSANLGTFGTRDDREPPEEGLI